MIDESIRLKLIADADVADIVDDNIYANKAPQDTVLPYVVYRMLNENEEMCSDGATGLESCTIEFDCMASSRSSSRLTAKAIWDALKNYRGMLTNDYHLQGAFRTQGADDDFDEPVDAADSGIFHRVLPLTLWYRNVPS